jgi:hypothetical protein
MDRKSSYKLQKHDTFIRGPAGLRAAYFAARAGETESTE